MGAKKINDLAVKTGSYTKNGETKGRFENVGSLMQSDDGSQFILLKRTFNPAGVPCEPDRDQILISVFELRDDPPQRQQAPAQQRESAPRAQSSHASLPDDDSIPF